LYQNDHPSVREVAIFIQQKADSDCQKQFPVVTRSTRGGDIPVAVNKTRSGNLMSVPPAVDQALRAVVNGDKNVAAPCTSNAGTCFPFENHLCGCFDGRWSSRGSHGTAALPAPLFRERGFCEAPVLLGLYPVEGGVFR
jgi:hypothetical protein